MGLSGYVPGWSAKGHPGYQGYAWYRIHLTVTPPVGKTLALLGPWAVDSVYQVYGNGTFLGGVGDFKGSTPVAHGNHYPRLLAFPPESASGGAMAIAIRVWMGPWAAAAPGAGGIHIAPAIGESEAITARYHLQWLKIFEGYAVDAVPAVLFFLLAVMVLCLWPCDRTDRAYPWLAAALLLSGIQRGNQAFFFWWEIETIQDLMLAQVLGRPWLFDAVFPHSASVAVRYLITCVRLAFLLVLMLIVHQGIRHQGREAWYALPAVLAIGVVLFTSELVAAHVPGIWFPWGVGLSLSECASVVFDALLFTLLVRRLWGHARQVSGTARVPAKMVAGSVHLGNVG